MREQILNRDRAIFNEHFFSKAIHTELPGQLVQHVGIRTALGP